MYANGMRLQCASRCCTFSQIPDVVDIVVCHYFAKVFVYLLKHLNIANSKATPRLLDMAEIVAVFLHELAHAITPSVKIKEKNGPWVETEHPQCFYENYALILRKSEELDIFCLPKTPDKFSVRNLKRFDNIDTNYMPFPKHCCPRYRHLNESINEQKNIKINIDVCVTYKNQSKLGKVSLNGDEEKELDSSHALTKLHQVIKSKFPNITNLKEKKIIETTRNERIDTNPDLISALQGFGKRIDIRIE
ncbi:hypothetical protein RFI_08669 [Reticulomyxa filosa]|uniref:Uncharacterized protein n=1 Tax=Reticulomyxa filosa TaxID=46433 RepID=X6NRY1_RETFI|nr:hypothetical protein RFI_08669 [Reticulomyxa filosa]|eukprot:ETO28464.1 hypothetical protein RFI_08669 [Reticulomyxa filosa]